MNVQSTGLSLESATLDALLPMHLVLGADGTVLHVAPTLKKVFDGHDLIGTSFFDGFEVLRPRQNDERRGLEEFIDARMRLRYRHGTDLGLKASLYRLHQEQGYLMTMSFGISVVGAVAEHELTGADFSPNDPTIEMLYLAEANAAAMREARRLIGRLQMARDTAEDASLTDPLTGLRNRRGLDTAAEDRFRSGKSFTLLQLDLDYFKSVNDEHGHAAGDAVLVAIAQRLQDAVRPADLVARIGGDEFVLLLQPPLEASQMLALAHRMISAIEEPVPFHGLECHVSASAGFVSSRDYQQPTLEDMLRDADVALYEAKTAGRRQAIMGTATMDQAEAVARN